MRETRFGLLFAVFLLAACDHPKKAEPASSSASLPANSEYTGEHNYPRALPVAVPAPPPQPTPASPPPVLVAATPPPAPEPLPGPEPTPATATNAPTNMASPPTPADTATDMTRLAVTPPTVTPLAPAPMTDTEAQKQVVVLQTSLGPIVIELDDVAAPRTCGNFRKLVADGFYDHTLFHRVIPDFMIQGGDPNSKSTERATYGQGDPGYTLPAEIQLKHTAGAVAMARLPDAMNPQRESNGSQFFICVAACPSLDGQYSVFGRVIQGLDVARKIANQSRDIHDDPIDRIEMKATLETKREALEATTTP